MQQQEQSLTVVCVNCAGGNRADALAVFEGLAARHGGITSDAHPQFAFAAFPQANASVRMALDLQRMATGARLPIGVASGRLAVATAKFLADGAAAGTVRLTAAVYDAVVADYLPELDRCIQSPAYAGPALQHVCLTLPPTRGAQEQEALAILGLC